MPYSAPWSPDDFNDITAYYGGLTELDRALDWFTWVKPDARERDIIKDYRWGIGIPDDGKLPDWCNFITPSDWASRQNDLYAVREGLIEIRPQAE